MRYREITSGVESKLTDDQRRELGLPPRYSEPQSAPLDATTDERLLHDEILTHCKQEGWLAFHGSMAHRTFRTAGEPDFIILLPDGKLLLVECKAKNGKLSPEQIGVAMWAEKLGHKVHLVRSFQEFLLHAADLYANR